MSKSKVYFMNLRTKPGRNLIHKFNSLLIQSGIKKIDFKDKFTAIKIHFGEPGNLAYIRPNYAAQVVNLIKELGGRPFLTDANTLYSGKRANALDHLQTAYQHGFNPLTVGCHIVIADGIKGTSYREIEINKKHCSKAKIGTAIADADIVISMNHFKGHDMTGFGGALKNLGMGCGSRGGKMEMHSASKPWIKKVNCVSCGQCISHCPVNAISFDENKKADIDYDKCIGCGQCVAVCRHDASLVKWDEAADIANEKIAEYAYAVVNNKPNFHINFIMNVSPNCDCWAYNDVPIVPDIGIAASFDPVALDMASVDLVNKTPIAKGCELDEKHIHECDDKFNSLYINTNWKCGIEHAEKIGLGNKNYELVVIK
ncbi:DUF362 domain-containing protein [Haloimpatiens sp. FM7330]|uniref:DUF362 domain-containing protein n=1 Tax=Haloimpatiens sp. FM7330 TaxID=3298610 RepID=UPI003644A0D3